jgi:hypothetical protein
MAKMSQSKTDFGSRGETGEKLPKGAASSDKSAGRKEPLKGGVGQGKADKTGTKEGASGRTAGDIGKYDGRLGEFNDGNMGEREIYSHKRVGHDQDAM